MDSPRTLPKLTEMGNALLYTYEDDDADTTERPTCIPPEEVAEMKRACGFPPQSAPPPEPPPPAADGPLPGPSAGDPKPTT